MTNIANKIDIYITVGKGRDDDNWWDYIRFIFNDDIIYLEECPEEWKEWISQTSNKLSKFLDTLPPIPEVDLEDCADELKEIISNE